MKHLYLDNFRGFENTCISTKDVNFLVGENSSGKTSFLELLCLLTSPTFWLKLRFNTNFLNFGSYKDIVNIHGKNKTYFKVGISENINPNDPSTIATQSILLIFREKEGQPVCSDILYNFGKWEIHINLFKNKFHTKRKDHVLSGTQIVRKFFNTWFNPYLKNTTGYKKLPKGLLKSPIPILFMMEFLITQADQNLKKEELVEFTMGMEVPNFVTSEMAWIAPIRTKPKNFYNTYDTSFSPEGTHTPYIIKRKLDSKKEGKIFLKFLRDIGKTSGLFDSIEIKKFTNSATSPFELNIIIKQKSLRIDCVGYGVSQSLPILVELLIRKPGTSYAIQQPEVHLHPKAQAALGDVFFRLALEEKKTFYIETHSDYTIDRFRLNFRRRRKEKPTSQILFFEQTNLGNKVTAVPIDAKGQLSGKQPTAYRNFFIKEQMTLLGI